MLNNRLPTKDKKKKNWLSAGIILKLRENEFENERQ